MGKRLTLSPIQTVFKFLIQFVFQVLEHLVPGHQYPRIHDRTLVVVSLPAPLADIVLRVYPVPVRQDGLSADGALPLHQSGRLVVHPSLDHPVEVRVIDQVQVLFLHPVQIPGEPFQAEPLQPLPVRYHKKVWMKGIRYFTTAQAIPPRMAR